MPSKLTPPNPDLLPALDAVRDLTDLVGTATGLDKIVGYLLLTDPAVIRSAALAVLDLDVFA